MMPVDWGDKAGTRCESKWRVARDEWRVSTGVQSESSVDLKRITTRINTPRQPKASTCSQDKHL